MGLKSGPAKEPAEQVVKEIRRATRRQFSAEEKIRIVLSGLRGEDSIAELCRREGIVQNLYYRWSKEFLEAGKKRLAGDTARAATSDEVKDLRREASALKEVVAELMLENRLLKKTYGPPRPQEACASRSDSVCVNVSGLGAVAPAKMEFARPGPHKRGGGDAPFFSPGFQSAGSTVRPSRFHHSQISAATSAGGCSAADLLYTAAG
jgi:transposase